MEGLAVLCLLASSRAFQHGAAPRVTTAARSTFVDEASPEVAPAVAAASGATRPRHMTHSSQRMACRSITAEPSSNKAQRAWRFASAALSLMRASTRRLCETEMNARS